MKLVDFARKAIQCLRESGEAGIKSDKLAEMLQVPKRRVYDVIAVLKALDLVQTARRFDGTTITWIDQFKDFVPRSEFETLKATLDDVIANRNQLQVEVAELKEQIRLAKSRMRHEPATKTATTKTEFNTTQLTIRALSRKGFKSVRNSGVTVVLETFEPGMTVDPTVLKKDETDELIRALQRL